MQDTKDERVVISYASHALTPVEQRYSQTEREALAVVFGCVRYHLYVTRSRFTVVTDHKPLVSVYKNLQSNPPTRIERWTLRVQRYDMTVVYQPGKDNPADYLSRRPDPHPKAYRAEVEGKEYVNFVAINAVPNNQWRFHWSPTSVCTYPEQAPGPSGATCYYYLAGTRPAFLHCYFFAPSLLFHHDFDYSFVCLETFSKNRSCWGFLQRTVGSGSTTTWGLHQRFRFYDMGAAPKVQVL